MGPYRGKSSPVPLHLRPAGIVGFDHQLGVALWRGRAAAEHIAKAGRHSGRDGAKRSGNRRKGRQEEMITTWFQPIDAEVKKQNQRTVQSPPFCRRVLSIRVWITVSALPGLHILQWLLGQRVVHRFTDTQWDKNISTAAGRDEEMSDLPPFLT